MIDSATIQNFLSLRILSAVEGIGPVKIKNLMARFGSAENVLRADKTQLKQVEGVSTTLCSAISKWKEIKEGVEKTVNKELELLEKLNARILLLADEDYPESLKNIYSPPPILYIVGTLTANDADAIAIVGTRRPTDYGKATTEKISTQLAKQGITIVSGAARGIDTAAHKAALHSGGRTIAVLGSGFGNPYPPENKSLLREIAESGCVVTEFSYHTKPDAGNFPQRNRIISGLSLGVTVVESGIKGGAVHTAALAIDQGKEVFAVPGNMNSKQSEGTNILIQRGQAKLVMNSEDITIELKHRFSTTPKKQTAQPKIQLSIFEEQLYQVVTEQPKHIDAVAEESGLSMSEVLVHLLSLEFKGLVRQLPGKMFSRM